VLRALTQIRDELELNIAALEDEIERRKDGTWERDARSR
jgi:hypothetical protein